MGEVVGEKVGGWGRFRIKGCGWLRRCRLRTCMLLCAELGFGCFAGEISTPDEDDACARR